jgi:hypothetical protein
MREDQVVIWYTSVHVTQSVQVLTPMTHSAHVKSLSC